jgi:hypothetical protein
VEVEAQALTDFGQALPQIAASGFLQSFLTPTNPPLPDAWMDLLGQNVYGLTRNPAVATQGNVQIVDSASAGPFTITVGQLTFASTTGVLFSNTAGGTLAKGGLLVLPVAATTAGASGNVGLNSITSIVGGTLPGVTVSNPGTAGVWITVSGVDQETSQSYAIRAQNRWPSLGIGATPATYDYWARTASPNVTRTRVFADAVTPGQVDVYLAGAAAPVAAGDVTAVQALRRSAHPVDRDCRGEQRDRIADQHRRDRHRQGRAPRGGGHAGEHEPRGVHQHLADLGRVHDDRLRGAHLADRRRSGRRAPRGRDRKRRNGGPRHPGWVRSDRRDAFAHVDDTP